MQPIWELMHSDPSNHMQRVKTEGIQRNYNQYTPQSKHQVLVHQQKNHLHREIVKCRGTNTRKQTSL